MLMEQLFTEIKQDGRFTGYHSQSFKSDNYDVQIDGFFEKKYITQKLVDIISRWKIPFHLCPNNWYFSIINNTLYLKHQYLLSSRYLIDVK